MDGTILKVFSAKHENKVLNRIRILSCKIMENKIQQIVIHSCRWFQVIFGFSVWWVFVLGRHLVLDLLHTTTKYDDEVSGSKSIKS